MEHEHKNKKARLEIAASPPSVKEAEAVKLSLHGQKGHVVKLAFSDDGKYLASASAINSTVCVWDAHTGEKLNTLQLAAGSPLYLDFIDAECIDIWLDNSEAWAWDWRSGFTTHSKEPLPVSSKNRETFCEVVHDACGIEGETDKLSFDVWARSNDDRYSAFPWATTTVVAVDRHIKGISGIKDFKGHKKNVLAVAFSADSRKIVSASADGDVRVWDVETCACDAVFVEHVFPVFAVACSPTGAIASADESGTILVWV